MCFAIKPSKYIKEKCFCWVCRYWPASLIKLFYKEQEKVIKIQNDVAGNYLLCYYFEDSCHQKIYFHSIQNISTIFSKFDHLNQILKERTTGYRSVYSDHIKRTWITMKTLYICNLNVFNVLAYSNLGERSNICFFGTEIFC